MATKKSASKNPSETTPATTAPKKKTARKAKVAAAPPTDPSIEDETLLDEEGAEETEEKATGKPRKRSGALVIVESPAKANTIKRYLGAGYVVKASVGHVKDLPKKSIGVDVNNNFLPEYVVIDGKGKVLAEIKAAAKKVERVYLAPDPDREGEAIAWHIAEEIRGANDNIQRVLFNEITKRGITEAMQKPMELDAHKFESQQARRILDRLVGYQISPVLWSKVKRGLSAGRVQSVAVRLVVERENEIRAFVAEEYWTLDVDVQGLSPPQFVARAVRYRGEKLEIHEEGMAREVESIVKSATLKVASIERKERRKNPPAPFITSKLQQEASSKLRFSPKKTMALAQRLYEGIDLGAEGPTGLITYMRTDSTRLSDDAVTDVRQYIVARYGERSLPEKPNTFRSKKSAQDAHEAIRPTDTKYDPEAVRRLVAEGGKGGRDERETEDLMKLYSLIWNRFIACQMVPAVFDQTAIDIEAGTVGLRATGQILKFPGFLEVYNETVEDAAVDEDAEGRLPDLQEGEAIQLIATRPEQHFTQPPPRFSEATLVKELEEKGIGRPSTYAAILSTVQDRGYVERKEGRLYPTELGVMVNSLLVKSFPEIVSAEFTSQLEEQLDKVEEGSADWVKLLSSFYKTFSEDVAKAQVEMRNIKREEIPTDHVCEKCSKPMVIKWGRNGHFLACTGYPECKNTKEYAREADGTIKIVETTRASDEKCPACQSDMVIRRGRFGEFLACSKYPECKTTKPISLGVACPREGCGGFLTQKRSKRGKIFYGCANYASKNCEFVLWDRPLAKPCPQCASPYIVEKVSRSGTRVRCPNPGCGYTADANDAGDDNTDGTAAAS
ncbi:MAG: type I DNA topoisomerase [Deltaproteobacteria bacterium]|nr:type I DNA topoisomerase [Deltaproteobacteria bacterium]